MDIGSATSTSLYNYQTNLKSGSQSSAILQALDSAYTSASAADASSDPTTALLGASTVGALTIGINAVNQAANSASGSSGSSSAISGLSSATFGGLNSTSAISLLAGLGSSSSSSAGLQGFGASVLGSNTLAIAAYQAQQDYPASTPAAQTSPSSTPTTTIADTSTQTPAVPAATSANAATQDQVSPAALQQAVQAALNPAVVSLLA